MKFYKYQGTGNDFIIVDNRNKTFKGNVALLCDRKFGIGADGLMLLQTHPDYDFEMIYYNSDGKTSSMCGNGGRCLVAFAKKLGVIKNEATFLAVDGSHQASIDADGKVFLGMQDVPEISFYNYTDLVLNTGSPHYVKQIENLSDLNIVAEAQAIRYNEDFNQDGINVNFISIEPTITKIRTYERGVEDETLSCGTGVTAAALSTHQLKDKAEGTFLKTLSTQGGMLQVKFDFTFEKGYYNIQLIGPAILVFEGEV